MGFLSYTRLEHSYMCIFTLLWMNTPLARGQSTTVLLWALCGAKARAGPDTLHQGGGAPAPPPAARHLRHSVLNLLKIYASHDMNVFLDIQENVM